MATRRALQRPVVSGILNGSPGGAKRRTGWLLVVHLRPWRVGGAVRADAELRVELPMSESAMRRWMRKLADGTTIEIDAARLAAPFDRALRACALALPLLAAGLVIARL